MNWVYPGLKIWQLDDIRADVSHVSQPIVQLSRLPLQLCHENMLQYCQDIDEQQPPDRTEDGWNVCSIKDIKQKT